MKRLSFQIINTEVGYAVRLFRCSMNGFISNNKVVPLYCIFHNHNHIGAATRRAGGLQPPVKDRDTLIEQSVTQINEAHRIIVKQVVYDEFVRTVLIFKCVYIK